MMSNFFIHNDKFYKEDIPVVTPGNRSLRYGDGLFETMKVQNGVIQLQNYHFERLFPGMKILQFEIPKHFTEQYLADKIKELCKKNEHTLSARVRLMVFRGNGGLYDIENHLPNYIIQTWNLETIDELNSNGLIIDVYADAKKACDKLSNIKHNNFLPYTMAAMHAQRIKVNDCVVLNTYDRICDTSIANIFIIKERKIYTPPLSEGCIAGVMRRFILEKLQDKFDIKEKQITIEELEKADEVFLTNSIKGIRWVKQFRQKIYKNDLVQQVHSFIQSRLV